MDAAAGNKAGGGVHGITLVKYLVDPFFKGTISI
jgi:hypothetical protein